MTLDFAEFTEDPFPVFQDPGDEAAEDLDAVTLSTDQTTDTGEPIVGDKQFTGVVHYDQVVRHKVGKYISITHESFGDADPTGAADSRAAVIAAMDWIIGTPNYRGSFIYFPPSESGTTKYKIASAIDLDDYPYVCFAGGGGAGGHPRTQIVGGGTNKLFTSSGADAGGHEFHNLWLGGGSYTPLDFQDGIGLKLIDCTLKPDLDPGANDDNTGLLLRSGFWCWYEHCDFFTPGDVTTRPAIIWRGFDDANAKTVYLQYMSDCRFWYRGISHQQDVDHTSISGAWHFNRITTEQFADDGPGFLELSRGGTATGQEQVSGVYVSEFGHYDPTGGGTPPLVTLNADTAMTEWDFTNIRPCGDATLAIFQADIANGALVGSGEIRGPIPAAGVVRNFAGALADLSTSFRHSGENTWEAVGPDTGVSGIRPWSVRRHTDTANRLQVTADGVIEAGPGNAAVDLTLYRRAANEWKTDDKFIAALGLGVGNSAAASTPGTVTKKIEVFDASGASLGYVAVFDAIT